MFALKKLSNRMSQEKYNIVFFNFFYSTKENVMKVHMNLESNGRNSDNLINKYLKNDIIDTHFAFIFIFFRMQFTCIYHL